MTLREVLLALFTQWAQEAEGEDMLDFPVVVAKEFEAPYKIHGITRIDNMVMIRVRDKLDA